MKKTPSSLFFYIGLLLLLVASRVFTSIYYIEDFDSLNFATGIINFNLKANQPHFPGYPVFILIGKLLYMLTGSFAIAFSILGGISLFVIIVCAAQLFDIKLISRFGFIFLFLFFFNPAFWLMSNRYMPDLGGVALLLSCLSLYKRKDYGWMLFACGILAGWRISYLPFVLPVVFLALHEVRYNWKFFGMGVTGIIIWFLPFVLVVGWEDLVFVAQRQINGHFNDFGGSVVTEPDLSERIAGFVENIWAFGLGGWWPGRHWITLVVSAGIVVSLVWAIRGGVRFPKWLLWCLLSYLVWVVFFQNVLYKSRHELPFLPFIMVLMYFGIVLILRYSRWWVYLIPALYSVSLAFLTTNLVRQHSQSFSTFAQLTEALRGEPRQTVLYTDRLLIDFLKRQGIHLDYREVGKDPWLYYEGVMVVGEYGQVFPTQVKDKRMFYHNRYVNKMHESLALYVY